MPTYHSGMSLFEEEIARLRAERDREVAASTPATIPPSAEFQATINDFLARVRTILGVNVFKRTGVSGRVWVLAQDRELVLDLTVAVDGWLAGDATYGGRLRSDYPVDQATLERSATTAMARIVVDYETRGADAVTLGIDSRVGGSDPAPPTWMPAT
jgi:hypothetical protein